MEDYGVETIPDKKIAKEPDGPKPGKPSGLEEEYDEEDNYVETSYDANKSKPEADGPQPA